MKEDLKNRFSYHAPDTDEKIKDHQDVRHILFSAAVELDEFVPEGREKALMLIKLEEALFWANAAIARS